MNGDGCPAIGTAHPFWFEDMLVCPSGVVEHAKSEYVVLCNTTVEP